MDKDEESQSIWAQKKRERIFTFMSIIILASALTLIYFHYNGIELLGKNGVIMQIVHEFTDGAAKKDKEQATEEIIQSINSLVGGDAPLEPDDVLGNANDGFLSNSEDAQESLQQIDDMLQDELDKYK